MSEKRKRKRQGQIYLPPSVFVGELISWKGYFWKVQAYSLNGGDVTLEDENGKQAAVATQACLVLEMYKKTAGTEKRERAAAKRPARMHVNGFRPNLVSAIGKPSPKIEQHSPSWLIQPTAEEVKRLAE